MIPLQIASAFTSSGIGAAVSLIGGIAAGAVTANVSHLFERRNRKSAEAELDTELRDIRVEYVQGSIRLGGSLSATHLQPSRVPTEGEVEAPSLPKDEIEVALDHLRLAGRTLERLENEIKERGESVKELREQQLALALSDDQIESIKSIFHKDFVRSNRQQVVLAFVVGAFWFGAGIGVTLLFGW